MASAKSKYASSQISSPPPPPTDRRKSGRHRYSHTLPQNGYGYHGNKVTIVLAVFTSPEKGWRTVPLTFDKHRTDDRELWSKIRIVYRDELEKPWRRMLLFKKLKHIMPIEFSNAGVPKRQQPKDGTSSHEFMHAYHHPRAFRPADHNWIDWFVQYKTDPSKSYGLEFVEGLWAEKLAFIAICFTVGIIITSVVWCVKGGDLQTVFTVMGFVLSGVAAQIALVALYYQITLPG